MRLNDKELEKILESTITEIRDEKIDAEVVESAAGRVWKRVAANLGEASQGVSSQVVDHPVTPSIENDAEKTGPVASSSLRNCADFQALIPHLLESETRWKRDPERPADWRLLLLEDHTHSCVTCRKALLSARSRKMNPDPPQAKTRSNLLFFPRGRWALGIAAALLVGLGLSQWSLLRNLLLGHGTLASVQEINGTLYRLSDAGIIPMTEQAVLREGDVVRTAKASGAMIRLADGSMIEMSARSELSLVGGWSGTTVHLDRGNVIVQAAKQRSRRLFLATPECLVTVAGTVFAVDQSIRGARVSVVEGEVRVDQGRKQTVLHPGQQMTTDPNLSQTSVDAEIAWSRNFSIYAALLKELKAVNTEITRSGLAPGLRYSSRLLDLAPKDTVLFASIPNFGKTLSETHRLLKERIQQNEGLRQWYAEMMKASQGEAVVEEVLQRLRAFGEYLDNEIVLAIPINSSGHYENFILLASVSRTSDFEPFLKEEVGKLNNTSPSKPFLMVVESPSSLSPPTSRHPARALLVYYRDGILALTPSAEQLSALAARLEEKRTSGFRETEFCSRLLESYHDGVGWLFGLDMQKVVEPSLSAKAKSQQSGLEKETLSRMGMLDVKYLIVEHKEKGEKSENRAALSFDHTRRGLASWLAAPGPMGSLNFVSPEAHLVAAFVIKNPVSLMDELFEILENSKPSFRHDLEDFQSRHGINIREDLAAPLGGEFAFALDGPVLPKPSWKVVMEVYDPVRLQRTLGRLVDEINHEATSAGKPGLRLDQENNAGRTYYKLGSVGSDPMAQFLYYEGYLLVSPSRPLLDQAIQSRQTGYSITRSEGFTRLLPVSGRGDFSALVYQNLAPLIRPLAGVVGNAAPSLGTDQKKALEDFVAGVPPTLMVAYGEENRIVLASTGDLGYLGLNLGSFLHMGGTLSRMGQQE